MTRISCLLALTLAAACGGSNNASVALSARSGTTASTAASAVNQQAQPLQACGGIVITRLRMVVSEVKLEGPAATDAGTADEVEFKSAPMLLDLSGTALDNGTTQQVTVADVRAGTYTEMRFRIHDISASEAGSDAGLQAMAAKNASIIVDYTNGGAPLTFVSNVDAQQKLEGTFNLTEGSHAMTLNVDASTWFTKAGACLDPSKAGNLSDINNNIQNSLKAFQDDDHNGREDHS